MLRVDTVREELLTRLRELMTFKELEQFYLVGGTALSLYYGHRHSVDIDLFTHEKFNSEWLDNFLASKIDAIEIRGISEIFLFCFIDGVKVDFVNNFTPLQFPLKIIDGFRIADERDIVSLKLKAIFQRGSKKDFVDLFVLLKHYSMEELIDFFRTKYPRMEIGQLLMSMYYFGDAENTEMPILLIDTNWEKIKKELTQKVVSYLKS